MATSLIGVGFRAVAGLAVSGAILSLSHRIIPPLVKELRVFSNLVWLFNPSFSAKVSDFAKALSTANKMNWVFFAFSPLTAQLPVVHGGIGIYRVVDFILSIVEAEKVLLKGVSINTNNANINLSLIPKNKFSIAKDLILGNMVPADDVRIANDFLRAVYRLDRTLANHKLEKLVARMQGYGTVVGNAEFNF